ncbi:MAG TPA: aminotransferase class V-fold PLP-dependent enzyme [Ktedonobacteraceae bacterium]
MLNISRLPTLSLEEASQLQFRLVAAITQEFAGSTWLTRGDLGVNSDNLGSQYTRAAERVLARMFGTEDAVFVTGAGTGAIRAALFAMLPPLSRIIVHAAPMYSTTGVTFRAAGYQQVAVDFNDLARLRAALQAEDIRAVYIQHTRQQLADRYVPAEVVQTVRALRPEMLIVVDDNYAVANTTRIGVELGADISAFSSFKLLGPEGIGIILCSHEVARRVRADMYSGGTRVQGFQAQEALIGLTQSFVLNTITKDTAEEIVQRLQDGAAPGITEAYVANMQSPVILAHFERPIAPQVYTASSKYGAAPFPVGAMSRYELIPMFYRISGSMTASLGAGEEAYWIRINPMRAGAETVLTILRQSISEIVGREV